MHLPHIPQCTIQNRNMQSSGWSVSWSGTRLECMMNARATSPIYKHCVAVISYALKNHKRMDRALGAFA